MLYDPKNRWCDCGEPVYVCEYCNQPFVRHRETLACMAGPKRHHRKREHGARERFCSDECARLETELLAARARAEKG